MSTFNFSLPGLSSKPAEPESATARLLDSIDSCSQLGFMQRMTGFALCVLAALFFLVSCMYSIPLIMLGRPDKFAVPFVIANILMLISTCFLSGLRAQMANMFTNERRIASTAYLVSLIASLYFALYVQRWYLVLPSICVQLFSLIWHVFGFIDSLIPALWW
jgi:hypothetical protein